MDSPCSACSSRVEATPPRNGGAWGVNQGTPPRLGRTLASLASLAYRPKHDPTTLRQSLLSLSLSARYVPLHTNASTRHGCSPPPRPLSLGSNVLARRTSVDAFHFQFNSLHDCLQLISQAQAMLHHILRSHAISRSLPMWACSTEACARKGLQPSLRTLTKQEIATLKLS